MCCIPSLRTRQNTSSMSKPSLIHPPPHTPPLTNIPQIHLSIRRQHRKMHPRSYPHHLIPQHRLRIQRHPIKPPHPRNLPSTQRTTHSTYHLPSTRPPIHQVHTSPFPRSYRENITRRRKPCRMDKLHPVVSVIPRSFRTMIDKTRTMMSERGAP